MNNNSVYGAYDTRKFSDIYENVNIFVQDFTFYTSEGLDPNFININVGEGKSNILTINTIYYLLLARYANSHIAGSDENQFKLRLFSCIFRYGPTWEKRLEIQNKLRGLTENDLLIGSKMLINNALNPSTPPTTDTLYELPTINNQTVNKTVKSKIKGYAELISLLEADVTGEFLKQFDSLFIKIVQPQRNLWYVSELHNQEDNE